MRGLLILTLLTCTHLVFAGDENQRIQDATQLVAKNPKQALSLLNTITNPKTLPADQYQEWLIQKSRGLREIGDIKDSQQIVSQLLELTATSSQFNYARSLRQQGEIHYDSGRYGDAETSFSKAYDVFIRLDEQRQAHILTLRLSAAMRTQGRYWDAIAAAQKARDYFEQRGEAKLVATSYGAIALAGA